jgi:single stranded DNA-binding protein
MSQAVITVSGKLSRDAEIKFAQSGTKMVILNIPVSKGRDKPTTWYSAVVSGKRADNDKFVELLKKGAGVVVSGELEFKIFEKNDGTTGYSHSIYANSIDIISYAPESGQQTEEEVPF